MLNNKIVSLEELEGIVRDARARGKKVILSHGVFDLVHPGHILHFKSAKKHGDILLVTITPDEYVRKGPGRPYFNQRLRMETISAVEYVDYVALNNWPTAVETIRRLKPHYYAKGSDYAQNEKDVSGNIVHEVGAVESYGGKVLYTDDEMFSSSNLLNRFFQHYPPEVRAYLDDFRLKRSANEIIEALKGLADMRVLVIGEAIWDQYHYCQALGKPPKDSIVSSRYLSHENFAGGAVAIANHLANFCKEVVLVTSLGDDDGPEYFKSKIAKNVNFIPIIVEGRPTIIKRRFLDPAFLTKMFEIQYLNDEDLDPSSEEEAVSALKKQIEGCDLVTIADFGHGLMTPKIKELLYDSRKYLALNTQCNSANMGFNPITKYRRANYVSIDEPELRFAAHSKYGSVGKLTSIIKTKLEVEHFLVSRGPHGCILFADNNQTYETPALSSRIVDRTGAGDALFAVTSPCAYKRVDPDIIGFVANCVGAMAVETVCNREPIDPAILYKFITYILK